MNENALLPAEVRTVELQGDELIAVLVEKEGKQLIYVPINPLVEHLGLAARAQRKRISDDPVLSEVAQTVRVERPAGKGGGSQEMLCLPLTFINGFLFGISSGRVRPELRAKVIQYQKYCYEVLAQAFGITETGLVVREETALSPHAASLAQIRDVALTVAQMAQEMIEQDERLALVEGNTVALRARLDEAARYVGGLEKRVRVVEERTSPRNVVTEEQADSIKAAVLALSNLIAERDPDPAKKTYYQQVYNTLYTHFQVSSYTRIRQRDYEAVLAFLEGWRNLILAGGATEDPAA